MPTPEIVLRAIAKERGQPYEQVAEEYGSPAPAPAPLEQPPQAPPAVEPVAVEAPQAAPPMAPSVVEQPPQAPAPEPVRPMGLDAKTAGATLEDVERLGKEGAEAARRVGEAEATAAQQQAERLAAWSKESDEIAAKYDAPEEAAAEMERRSLERVRALNKAAEDAPEIRDRRTGKQKVWGALSLALAGWAEGLGNQGAIARTAGILQAAAERDIDIQKSNLEGKRKTAAAAQSEYSLARQYLGDTREARQWAEARRKERFANDMAIEAAQLTSATARDRATITANALEMSAKKEQLDVLKSVVSARQQGVDAAWAAKGVSPSSKIPGPATKSQQGTVNVEAMRAASVPGLELTQDPTLYPADVPKAARDYKIKSDQFLTGARLLKVYYEKAADKSLPEVERRKALASYDRYRLDLISKMSVKNEQGVVTNPEMVQRVQTMPSPSINLLQQGKQSIDEAVNAAYYGSDIFDTVADEQRQEAAVTLGNYGYRETGGGGAPAADKPAKSKAPGQATSPKDFD